MPSLFNPASFLPLSNYPTKAVLFFYRGESEQKRNFNTLKPSRTWTKTAQSPHIKNSKLKILFEKNIPVYRPHMVARLIDALTKTA